METHSSLTSITFNTKHTSTPANSRLQYLEMKYQRNKMISLILIPTVNMLTFWILLLTFPEVIFLYMLSQKMCVAS